VRIFDTEDEAAMDNKLSDFQQVVRENNKASTVALECAAYVLRRALELPLEQRKAMIERLIHMVSVGGENEAGIDEASGKRGLGTGKDGDGQGEGLDRDFLRKIEGASSGFIMC
jgi:hypothetical protein